MSNEALALLIQSGSQEDLATLWNQIRDFICLWCNRYFNARAEQCRAAGVEVDDLIQESYFAMLKAIDSYRPEKGYQFLTYMTAHLKNACNGLIGARGKRQPLNRAKSLDAPISHEEETPLLDTIPDASMHWEDVEERLFQEQLKADMAVILGDLEPEHRDILQKLYYGRMTVPEAASSCGMMESHVVSVKEKALRQLRRDRRLKPYWTRGDVIDRHAYYGNYAAWYYRQGTSSTEYTALKLLERQSIGGIRDDGYDF